MIAVPLFACNIFMTEAGKEGFSGPSRTHEDSQLPRSIRQTTGLDRNHEGELTKAEDVKAEFRVVRTIDRTTSLATFLHSHPIGQRAATRELMVLRRQDTPDRIDLGKPSAVGRPSPGSLRGGHASVPRTERADQRELPNFWRTGVKNPTYVKCTMTLAGESLTGPDTVCRVRPQAGEPCPGAAGVRCHVHTYP